MRLTDIKRHLRAYSIVQRRKTTINHAFASALAPCDVYDEHRLNDAMKMLKQTDPSSLRCVYCESVAETWDHLVGLVKNAELRGYGHQIGNLVPCCRNCNASKGSRPWLDFVRTQVKDPARRERLESTLAAYVHEFATEIDISQAAIREPEAWQRYAEVKQEILELMVKADDLASRLRPLVMCRRSQTEGGLE